MTCFVIVLPFLCIQIIKKKMEHILEASSHNHILVAEEIEVISDFGGIAEIEVNGNPRILHGEHGSIAIESKRFKKYVQQEFNPMTSRYENAFD